MAGEVELFEYFLKPGYIFVYREPTAIYTVLGSCVSICLYDKELQFGGMNHFLFPKTQDARERTPKYGNVAVSYLITLMLEQGGNIDNLVAQIFGGAHRGGTNERNVGMENIEVAQSILEKAGIPVMSQDVGGAMGRKVIYSSMTNEAVVYKVESIRRGDWFPYTDQR